MGNVQGCKLQMNQVKGYAHESSFTPPASQDECRDRLSVQSDFLNSKEKANFIFNMGTDMAGITSWGRLLVTQKVPGLLEHHSENLPLKERPNFIPNIRH